MMKLVSFDAFRTLHFPTHTILKPEQLLSARAAILDSDWVLYPPYWLLNSLVYGLGARVFPSLPTYMIGHNKIEMTRIFELIVPGHVPWTLIRANTPENCEEVWKQMSTPFVAKLPKSSMGEGVFLIEQRVQWQRYCEKTDVLYAQECLPIDRDMRIVVIGDDIIGGYWRVQSPYSFHNNIARGGEILHGPIPPVAVELVRKIMTALCIDHAGFDIAMVGGVPYIFEFNRLFGNRGLNIGQMDVSARIVSYLQRIIDKEDPTKPVSPRGGTGKARKRRRVAY